MIFTKFGSEVEVASRIDEEGWLFIKREDGSQREVHLMDLRAEEGLKEISEAADKF